MKFNQPIITTARKTDRTLNLNDFFKLHEDFLKDKTLEGLAPRTMKDHVNTMKYFTEYATVNFNRTSEIDKNLFKNYIFYMLQEKHYKPCTINVRLRTMKTFLGWLHTNKHTPENLSLNISLVKVPKDTIQPLNKAEIRKMLDACNTNTYSGFRDYAAMLVILDTGIRINELCETFISDVDTKNRLLKVRAEISKTRVERVLPLSKTTVHILEQLKDIAEDNKCQYLLNSSNGVKSEKDYIIRNFQRYGEKVGIEKRSTPHVFRHTMAVEAVKKGMDVFSLQRILGHNNLSTTRQYIQLQTEDLQRKHAETGVLDSLL